MDVLSENNENGNGHENGSSSTFDANGNGEIKHEVKEESMSDDDVPWGERISREKGGSKKSKSAEKKKKRKAGSDSEDDEYKPEKKKKNKEKKKRSANSDSEDDFKPEKKTPKKAKKTPVKEWNSSDESDPDPDSESEEESTYMEVEESTIYEEETIVKTEEEENDGDDEPLDVKHADLIEETKSEKKKSKKSKKKVKKEESDEEDEEEQKDKKKKKKSKKDKPSSSSKTPTKNNAKKPADTSPKKKAVKKEEIMEDIWEWWKEEKKPDGVKWNSLGHKGPLFAPPYIPLPDHIHFKYDGKVMKLSLDTEEVAGFYAGVLDHEYSTKDSFNTNFFKDWRKVMTSKEREHITDLKKCDFREIDVYQKEQREIRKAMTKEEKLKIKEEKEAELMIYGIAVIDGHKQKVANFRIEPPGLFRGRGGHPKMGMLKKRIVPEDIIINCSKDTEAPVPPPGHKWKEVRHDNTVTWLCSWTESVLGQNKYIMLNPSSKIKGEKDHEKYETARRLKKKIDNIREVYTADFKSREMRVRQRATALYFIDKLALRAGNEKDVDESADTVGCCSLRVEHIKLYDSGKVNEDDKHEKENIVEFDFLGKDSIRYFNRVPVDKKVYKNLKHFMENKSPGDDLFDRLDTATLNEHLRSLMPGLTVKVFRTYNASITLQNQLKKLTDPKDNVAAKILSYNRANRQVAILCNHQRAVPKTFEKAMENLEIKITEKKAVVAAAKAEMESARGAAKEKAKKKYERLKDQYKKLKISRTDKDENKQVALGTSKLNYLDPRITIGWCKKYEIPLEKVFTKTLREKFRWAIDMVHSSDEEFVF